MLSTDSLPCFTLFSWSHEHGVFIIEKVYGKLPGAETPTKRPHRPFRNGMKPRETCLYFCSFGEARTNLCYVSWHSLGLSKELVSGIDLDASSYVFLRLSVVLQGALNSTYLCFSCS